MDPQMYQSVMKLYIQEMNSDIYFQPLHLIWLIMISILLLFWRVGEVKNEIDRLFFSILKSGQFSSNSLMFSYFQIFNPIISDRMFNHSFL